ncbi:DUF3139 domain-containing protein [Paenibacillus pabuli]|uniref:DUF3139 domain-containing protein n=1 Tax=Paenibacillus pabuli TaxID=1472 RepID=UPI003CEE17AA
MTKRLKIGLLSTLTLVVALSVWAYLGLLGNPFKKNDAEKKVIAYLQQKGYSPEELKDVHGTYSFKSSEAPYGASVTFADEPNEEYHYILFKDGNIVQYSYTSDNPKHQEPMVK